MGSRPADLVDLGLGEEEAGQQKTQVEDERDEDTESSSSSTKQNQVGSHYGVDIVVHIFPKGKPTSKKTCKPLKFNNSFSEGLELDLR